MKKEYIKPILKKGVSFECVNLIMASANGTLSDSDGDLQMDIHNTSVSGEADSRRGSFWDDSE